MGGNQQIHHYSSDVSLLQPEAQLAADERKKFDRIRTRSEDISKLKRVAIKLVSQNDWSGYVSHQLNYQQQSTIQAESGKAVYITDSRD
tara:strand:+ start:379 stop:645 length:267 start_codon:yes stop_codon:yes gene_type:complete